MGYEWVYILSLKVIIIIPMYLKDDDNKGGDETFSEGKPLGKQKTNILFMYITVSAEPTTIN